MTFPHDMSTRAVRAWRNTIFLVFALSGLGLATWAARLPAISAELNLRNDVVGFVILALSAGSILGLLAAPHLLRLLGPRVGMRSMLLLLAAGLALVGIGADGLHLLAFVVIGLAIFGFAMGAVDVLMNLDGTLVEKAAGRTLLPLMHAFFSLGTFTAAGIGTIAALLEIPVIVHLLTIAGVVALTAVVGLGAIPARSARPPLPEAVAAAASTRQRSVWLDPKLLLIGAVMLGMSFAEGAANDWLALAVVRGHGLDPASGALMLSVFTGAMFLGRVAGGPILDRFGRVPVLLTAAVLSLAGLATFLLVETEPLMIAGTVAWALGCSLGFPVAMSAAADHPTRSAERVSAASMIGYGAFLVGPPLLGLIGEQIGLLGALWIVFGLVALGTLAVPSLRPARPVPHSEADAPGA